MEWLGHLERMAENRMPRRLLFDKKKKKKKELEDHVGVGSRKLRKDRWSR